MAGISQATTAALTYAAQMRADRWRKDAIEKARAEPGTAVEVAQLEAEIADKHARCAEIMDASFAERRTLDHDEQFTFDHLADAMYKAESRLDIIMQRVHPRREF